MEKPQDMTELSTNYVTFHEIQKMTKMSFNIPLNNITTCSDVHVQM